MTPKNKKIVIGNWKMNPENITAAKKLIGDIKKKSLAIKKSTVVIVPPSAFFAAVKGTSSSKKILFGFQNVQAEKTGSLTGEVSAAMAESLGAKYVIIGHSERRGLGETDLEISKKVQAVMKLGMVPVLCIGEKEVDEHGGHLVFLKEQLKKDLVYVDMNEIEKVIIAYEPIYAVGATHAITSHQVHERNILIKKILSEMYNKEKAFKVKVLYGGSVNIENARDIIRGGEVDGLLVGRDSLRPENFIEIIKRIETL